jgi:fructosamine-3-kinase
MGSTRCGTEVLQGRRLFVKRAAAGAMLACEADGLRALAATGAIRVPAILAEDVAVDDANLVLEWLDLTRADGACRPRARARCIARRGCAARPRAPTLWLAPRQLHRRDASDQRLGRRLDRVLSRRAPRAPARAAHRNGYRGDLERDGVRLLSRLPNLLRDHAPSPSLVHGDLWQGNAGRCRTARPWCSILPSMSATAKSTSR